MDNTNFGGMGTWLIILILFLFMGNWFGGFWGLGGGNAAAWLLNGQNNNNNHDNTVDLINNNTQWQQQMMAQQGLANQTTLITQGFCNTNSNIEKAILQWQQNTAAIIASGTANTQKILDMMCNNTITQLRTDLAEARLEANNANQTRDLINRLAPYPTPSWIVSSPYTSIYPPTPTATA
jgi:hypothetical protein